MANNKNEIDQALFERIEAYLLGKMEMPERLKFENDMKEDAALREERELQKKLMAAVEAGTFLASAQIAQQTTEITPVRQLWKRWYFAAAAVVIAVSLIWLFWQPAAQKEVFARYFVPDPGLPVVMSSSDSYNFYDAMVSYKEGNYDEAIRKWEILLQQKSASDTLKYFIGMAHLNRSAFDSSRIYLQPVAESNESAFHLRAKWYLALTYVKTKDYASAVVWLKQIPDDAEVRKLLAEPALQQTR